MSRGATYTTVTERAVRGLGVTVLDHGFDAPSSRLVCSWWVGYGMLGPERREVWSATSSPAGDECR